MDSKKTFSFLLITLGFFFVSRDIQPAQAKCNAFDITCKDSAIRETGRRIDPTNPNSRTREVLRENDPTSREFGENQWGNAGGAAYPAASAIMRGRHGSSVGLDDIQKKYLRPYYGNLVDQVVVVYNARMMNEWTALGYKIPLGGVEAAAQTYCNRIYVGDSYQKGNRAQLLLLAHELRHSQQCQELGGEGKFGYHYFREYKRAGLSYENNALERSAEERANTIARSVPNDLIAASVSKINFCNKTSNKDVYAVFSSFDSTNGWKSNGWYKVDSNKCREISIGRPYNGDVYIYGQADQGRTTWSGKDATFCINQKVAFAIPNSDKSCNGSDYKRVGMNKFSIKVGTNTWNFNP